MLLPFSSFQHRSANKNEPVYLRAWAFACLHAGRLASSCCLQGTVTCFTNQMYNYAAWTKPKAVTRPGQPMLTQPLALSLSPPTIRHPPIHLHPQHPPLKQLPPKQSKEQNAKRPPQTVRCTLAARRSDRAAAVRRLEDNSKQARKRTRQGEQITDVK